jgi:hypothetical protein
MWLDQVNSYFEVVSSAIIWLNLQRLYKDQRIEGVSWLVTAWYVAFGCWGMVYYSFLGHWYSLAGQVVMTLGNLAWVVLAINLTYFKKDKL